METLKYYEPRYLLKTDEKRKNLSFGDVNINKTLNEYIFEYDKIILLGNPGIGKTRELENLFTKVWEEKEKTNLIPFSINLKYFRKANKFEELIPYPDWLNLPEIIFILDGFRYFT